jgi:Arc/MetJ family transcription regulator
VSTTNIEIDDDALAEAMRLFGTTTKKETVNKALTEAVARLKRLEALEKMVARVERGELDPSIHAYEARKDAQRSGT